MKIDFSVVLKNLRGDELLTNDKEKIPLTLAIVSCESLLSENKENMTGQEKSIRYSLAVKIYGHNNLPVELTAEEIVLIKACVAASYAPIVAGQAWKLLENSA